MGAPVRAARLGVAAIPADPDVVVVTHSRPGALRHLGLDAPLALAPTRESLEPEGMPSALGIDHVPGLRRFVADACRRSAGEGGRTYRQPPLALLGERGVGKGLAASWIAHSAGAPLFRMAVDEAGAFAGRADDGRHPLPAFPLIAMAAAGCANPVIVAELDVDRPVGADRIEELAAMIDPRRSRRWMAPGRDDIVDLSHVSWIVEVQARAPTGRWEPNAAPIVQADLPAGLADLIEDAGTSLRLLRPREKEDLFRLDVAICVCRLAGHEGPDAVAAVHGRILGQFHGTARAPDCARLVEAARRALAAWLEVRGA